MAVRHSSPLCAPVGLLLLLLGVFSSHLSEVQARPTDFWCNYQERKKMEQRTLEELKRDIADCGGSDTLPSPVQLPGVRFRVAEWANKTLQQRHAEVLGALQVLQDGVRVATNQTTSKCQSSLLQKLEHRIANHLLIVNQIQPQNNTVTPSESTVQNSTSQTRKVLDQYEKLLKGKLERLAIDHKDSICKV
ncbi:thrombopoietin-like [Thunnus thynnus]|uniref:thrombopoietin-like n=1 Tax=Thunnus thynnus TaxID=8237 RepID=UPI003527B1B3